MSRSIQNSFDIGNRGCFWKSHSLPLHGSTDNPFAVQLRKRHGTSNPSCDVRMARWSKIHECISGNDLTPGLSWATWPKISSSHSLCRKKNSILSAAQLSTPVPATLLQPADVILIRLTQGQCRPEGFQVSQGYQDTLNIVRAHKLETKHNIHRLQASNSFCSQFLLLLAFGLSNLHLRVTDLSNWSTASHADKVTQKRITGPAT